MLEGKLTIEDLDEQHRLIEEYHGRKMEPDHYLHIGGDIYKGYAGVYDLWMDPEMYDGWELRFSEGYTRRVNSVSVYEDGELDVNEKITYCENEYRSHGLPCIFKSNGIYKHSNCRRKRCNG